MINRTIGLLGALAMLMLMAVATPTVVAADGLLAPIDVFELEYASDPRISPDGKHIVYVRNSMDIMTDRRRANLWTLDAGGGNHRPLASSGDNFSSPRYSPDGRKLLYVSGKEGSSQLYLRWLDSGQVARLTNLTQSPRGLAFSPDGKWIAFVMFVPQAPKPFAKMPPKPKGAEWAAPVKVIDRFNYRFDGRGYLQPGFSHLFVVPAEGGTPRQLTSGDFNHNGEPAWSADGKSILISANRRADWEYEPNNSEIYEVALADGAIATLTDREGPDRAPVVSPNGKQIAYLGYDDKFLGYQLNRLYVMNRDGGAKRLVSGDFDRSIAGPAWAADGRGLYFQYNSEGNGKIGYISLDGKITPVARDLGGTSLGRPYSSGSFTVSDNNRIAYVTTRPDRPADVAVIAGPGKRAGKAKRQAKAEKLTALNDDLLGHRALATVEEIWFDSSFDGRNIQGWIVKPPHFDSSRKYPLVLEIHGGPFADYGDRFAAELQLYAAAGYVVLYTNPRGSTSYGAEFGNLIHHHYPGEDYDDLMSGVDAVIAKGYVDSDNLFVTGGSGGGVLSAWIVGKTGRFKAAVVAKPVINWTSWMLTADIYGGVAKYWFPGYPWEYQKQYWQRSPLSLVGHVTTPTMLLTGEADHRTPIPESEQFYQALKLRKIDTVMVRIPGAGHGITRRPSNLIAKVVNVLAWFDKYRADKSVGGGATSR